MMSIEMLTQRAQSALLDHRQAESDMFFAAIRLINAGQGYLMSAELQRVGNIIDKKEAEYPQWVDNNRCHFPPEKLTKSTFRKACGIDALVKRRSFLQHILA